MKLVSPAKMLQGWQNGVKISQETPGPRPFKGEPVIPNGTPKTVLTSIIDDNLTEDEKEAIEAL